MNTKLIRIIGLVVVLVAGVGVFYYFMSGNNGASQAANMNAEPQPVSILKYSDYQCPACKAYIPLQNQLKAEYGDLVTIEYRHFPLSGHQFAELAARTAEAARNQGKYEEMHDLIFQYQEVWSQGNARDHFMDFANQLELDMDQFEADLESQEIIDLVERQRQEGLRRQVNATPTFFINGQKLRQNPQSLDQFKSVVELYMYRAS
jgi:protein-disulfide isomerase